MVARIRSNWRRMLKWAGIGLIYLIPVLAVQGAFDIFIKIDTVPGESADAKHKDWIEVSSFSHEVSIPSDTASTGGGGVMQRSTKPDHGAVVIVKQMDKASPKLLYGVSAGTRFKDVTIDLCRTTGDKAIFAQYKLSDVIVTALKPAGSAQSSDSVPTESVSFNYSKIEFKYTPTDAATGKQGTEVKASWDLKTNKGS